jgi:hypothetical protein
MINKIVVHTTEKSSCRSIKMVVLNRDNRGGPFSSSQAFVIFGSEKLGTVGKGLLFMKRQIININNYTPTGMDVYLQNKIRFIDLRPITPEVAWTKILKYVDRYYNKATGKRDDWSLESANKTPGLLLPKNSSTDKFRQTMGAATLITNNLEFGKNLKRMYNSPKENE